MGRPIPRLDFLVGAPNFGPEHTLEEQYEKLYQRLRDENTLPEGVTLEGVPQVTQGNGSVIGATPSPVNVPAGRIRISSIPGLVKVESRHPYIDARLWAIVQQAAKETRIQIIAGSAFRTRQEQIDIYRREGREPIMNSHHLHGDALDLNAMGRGRADNDRLASWFRSYRYLDNGQTKSLGVLWQVDNHYDHIHINLRH